MQSASSSETPAGRGEERLRHVFALVALTVLQYGTIAPVIQFLLLSFFAASHGGGDCEEHPSSGPCRRAASDVAYVLGMLHGVAQCVACASALLLGSWSDRLGRRPIILAKVICSVLPVLAVALHVYQGLTLWVYLLLMPVYEAFDINAVFLGFVSDVVVDPRRRTQAFATLMLAFISAGGPAVALGGWLSAKPALAFVLTISVVKVLFAYAFLPETTECTDGRPLGVLGTVRAALELVLRNSFISRMAIVFVFAGQSLVGLSTVAKPYVTGYLGMDRPTSARFVFTCGCSVVASLLLGLKPLIACLGEVRGMQVCLCFAVVMPLVYCMCSEAWHVFAVGALFTGPMVLQFPVITSIKSNLVNEDEQGLMQGTLASFRVLAEAVASAFFGAFYSYSTNGGAAKDRWKAFPPFVLSSALGAVALCVACTLPDRPPLPRPKMREGMPVLIGGEIPIGNSQYSTVEGTSRSSLGLEADVPSSDGLPSPGEEKRSLA